MTWHGRRSHPHPGAPGHHGHLPAPVAQWIEQVPSKHLAAGSSPAGGTHRQPPQPLPRGGLSCRSEVLRRSPLATDHTFSAPVLPPTPPSRRPFGAVRGVPAGRWGDDGRIPGAGAVVQLGGPALRRTSAFLSGGAPRCTGGARRIRAGRGAGRRRRGRDRARDRPAARPWGAGRRRGAGRGDGLGVPSAQPAGAARTGDGDRLPFASGSLDLLAYAQSWHWTDPARSVPEALRALRPGGALAVWSNDPDTGVGWIADQQARIEKDFGPGWYINDHPRSQGGLEFTTRLLRWSRRIPVGAHLAKLATHSLFLIGAPGTDDFLAAERDRLRAMFPGGTIEEHYVVDLRLARAPGA